MNNKPLKLKYSVAATSFLFFYYQVVKDIFGFTKHKVVDTKILFCETISEKIKKLTCQYLNSYKEL
jgi:hypothetical protein